MILFYLLVGTCIATYIIGECVYPILSKAIFEEVDTLVVKHPYLYITLNITILALIWPISLVLIFSSNIRDIFETSVYKIIHTED